MPEERLPQERLPQERLPQERLPQEGLPQEGLPQERRRRSAHGFTVRVDYEDDGCRVLVALDGDESVGLASGGTSRDADAPTPWELYSLNVQRSAQGTGLADDLLTAALGARPASVWVLTDNARARSFYRRHGFAADGATKPHPGSGAPELRLVRAGVGPGSARQQGETGGWKAIRARLRHSRTRRGHCAAG